MGRSETYKEIERRAGGLVNVSAEGFHTMSSSIKPKDCNMSNQSKIRTTKSTYSNMSKLDQMPSVQPSKLT